MAERRTYEVVVIFDPGSTEDQLGSLVQTLQQTIEGQGATIVKNEDMGRRRLAYEIDGFNDGFYRLFEIEGTGSEIAELERRMRVLDPVIRYITVRVDLDRRRAEKFRAKRARRASNKASNRSSRGFNNQQQSENIMEAATVES